MTFRERMRLWLKPVLFLSLALNLFLAGVLIGRLPLPFKPWQGRPDVSIEFVVDRLAAGMSEPDQRVLREALARRQGELRPKIDDVKQALAAIQPILLTEHVDRAVLQAAIEGVLASRGAMQAEIVRLVVDTVPQLSLQGRRRVVEFMNRRAGRF